MIWALVRRDITLALRSGGAWLLGVIFFAVFLTFCAISLGGQMERLRELAAPLVWLAAIFSALLAFPQIFADDHADGTLENLFAVTHKGVSLITAKALAYFILVFLPILLAVFLAGIGFGLSKPAIWGLILSLLVAAPAITAYGVFASALSVSRGAAGFLVILITAPFMVPLLIFGVAAAQNYPQSGLIALEFRALIGLSLIAVSTVLPAAVIAIKTHFE